MAAEMLEVTDYLMSEVLVEKEYSPSTMYEDYVLNEYLFRKKIPLFVREQNRDEYGLAMSYDWYYWCSWRRKNNYVNRTYNCAFLHIIVYFVVRFVSLQ